MRRRSEHGQRSRSAVLILLAPVFLVALPALFIGLGTRVDQQMGRSPVPPPPANFIVGIPLILAGGALGLWSNHRIFTTGRGTPLPLMPTQELIIEPPYTFTRNPMALGAISLYLGFALLVRSLGTVLVVLLCAAALLTYIRFIEERELAAGFGPEYLDFRRRTPFLFPRMATLRRGWRGNRAQ
jgi:protein-S-isoprenylcysteine O-methyltransferase Ste14